MVFGLVHLSGDPVLLMVSSDSPPDVVATTRHALGFDRPLHVQFGDYVRRVVRGDLGISLRSNRPVSALIWERLPATVELTVAALLIAVAVRSPPASCPQSSAAPRSTGSRWWARSPARRCRSSGSRCC